MRPGEVSDLILSQSARAGAFMSLRAAVTLAAENGLSRLAGVHDAYDWALRRWDEVNKRPITRPVFPGKPPSDPTLRYRTQVNGEWPDRIR